MGRGAIVLLLPAGRGTLSEARHGEASLLWSLKVTLVKSLGARPVENTGVLRKSCKPVSPS